MFHFSLHRKGFTLAELMIAMVILAEIATFSIPKVLGAQQNSKRLAILKESISALNEATYLGFMKGDLTTSNVTSYYATKLNTLKICDTNAFSQGCWTHPGVGEEVEPGYILHNGATLAGFNNGGPGNGVSLDWNGAQSPNIEGQDIIYLQICFGSPCYYGARPGQVTTYTATSDTMYKAIFN